MGLTKREAIFAYAFNGFISRQRAGFCGDVSAVIRHYWALADRSLYHATRMESPQDIARRWINENVVIVDTVRAGSGFDGEIVDISIIDCAGRVLLDTLVKPSKDISESSEAAALYGITPCMLKSAPKWEDILPQVIDLTSRGWVSYHAESNGRMIETLSAPILLDHDVLRVPECVGRLYAEYAADWDFRQKKYKCKCLVEAACALEASRVKDARRSLFNCKLTVGVIRAMAGGAK